MKLVKEPIALILDKIADYNSINLIDLGCGTGKPAIEIIKFLKSGGINVNYIPIDVSKEILKIAESNIRKEFNNINIRSIHTDFDIKPLLYELEDIDRDIPSFFIMLSNTLWETIPTN